MSDHVFAPPVQIKINFKKFFNKHSNWSIFNYWKYVEWTCLIHWWHESAELEKIKPKSRFLYYKSNYIRKKMEDLRMVNDVDQTVQHTHLENLWKWKNDWNNKKNNLLNSSMNTQCNLQQLKFSLNGKKLNQTLWNCIHQKNVNV